MLPERRAVVFDMDDTLYPYRRFVLSGFAAAARHLHRTCGVDRALAFQTLARASRGAARGRELQTCLEVLDLPGDLLPMLVMIARGHQPALRLSREAIRALSALRAGGWRLGVLTNGPVEIQTRKASALRVADYVDRIVYATEHGSGVGKPEAEPFAEIARQLDVSPAQTVFVGDDELCDIEGATRAGMLPVRCAIWTRRGEVTSARTVIDQFSQVPRVARDLLKEASNRHAA